MEEVFIGRQPIYDRDMRTQAFELLFRAKDEGQAVFVDGDAATSEVIHSSLMDIGLQRLVGNKTAFVNLTRSFLTNGTAFVFPKDRVVLEVLEDIEIDDEVIAGVRALTESGYSIALDDYVYDRSHAPLLYLAKIVKIDLTRLTQAELHEHVRELRQYDVQLLAEKVETQEQYLSCLGLGFEYFQGYYLSRPTVVQGQRLPTSRLAVIELVNKLYRANVDLRDLEAHISRDVSLSYHLLRFINSAFYGLSRPVESIRRAVVYLGQNAIRNWITIMALRAMDDQHSDLLVTALVRGRMAQRLAEECRLAHSDSYFTVGIFSILEKMLHLPMEELLQELPLTEDVNAALLQREGPMGDALTCAIAFEFDSASETRHFRGLDDERTGQIYLESVAWAHDIEATVAQAVPPSPRYRRRSGRGHFRSAR
jgi:EAL and modified HD-GYP domain-containing signal transduction protein